MINYVVKAKHELVDEMIGPILTALKEVEADQKASYQLHLVLEEIFVNIVTYAYDGKDGSVDISYDIDSKNKRIKVIIKDKGKAFNPLAQEDPTFEGDAKDREIGGLGIFIVKSLVDDIQYKRTNNQNVLEIAKSI